MSSRKELTGELIRQTGCASILNLHSRKVKAWQQCS